MSAKQLDPVHPGEVLLRDFLEPMDLSRIRLARDLGVPPRRINEIVLKKRRITADISLRLARYFGISPKFWLGLQMDFALDMESDLLGDRLVREVGCYSKGSWQGSDR
jgi:addiction module HigA family antidote